MKQFLVMVLLGLSTATLPAMVFSDSRVLALAELQLQGVQIEVTSLPGPKEAQRHAITVKVMATPKGHTFRWVSFAILEKALDADFASREPKKSGQRDSGIWAKKIRGEASNKPSLVFQVSDLEVPAGYVKVSFSLPKDDGIAVFGDFYLPLSEIIGKSRQSAQASLQASARELTGSLPKPPAVEVITR